MSAQTEQELIVVGQLAGVFGVKGWLKVRSFTQPEDNILNYGPWRIQSAQGLELVEVDAFQVRPQGLVVHFKGLDDRDLAAAYGRAKIVVDKQLLPDLTAGDYYWHQLIGLKVISCYQNGSALLGEVAEMLETGANDVVVVKPCEGSIDGTERLIPYVQGQYVVAVDLADKTMRVDWDPEF
jgi:16S rRNA processing protein RimM